MNVPHHNTASDYHTLLTRFHALEAQHSTLLADYAKLQAENRLLQTQLAAAMKNSTNSSKPPSSDIVNPNTKPPILQGQQQPTIGGQPQHQAPFRELFDAEQITETYVHSLTLCPCCGGGLKPNGSQHERLQQVDIVLPKLIVTEHQFAEFGESYLTFITTLGLEPTNNTAERAIRFVVIDRMITQGTRGEAGRRWQERIWTVLATCRQQGVSAFSYLMDAIRSYVEGREVPSLLRPSAELKPSATPI